MKLESKNVCIVTHQFPPYGKVASRRWTLFARQLINQAANVKVISSRGLLKESPWSANGIDVVYLKDNYPVVLNSTLKSIFSKVLYRVWVAYIKLKFKGHPFDKGQFWLENVRKYISQNKFEQDTVFILTGAPFSLFRLGESIKEKGFRYILDYRDPSTWNNAYGFNQLSDERQKYEIESEKIAGKGAFKVTFADFEMMNQYADIYPEFADKCIVLPHPLDKLSISDKWKKNGYDSNRINLVYAGTLYDGCLYQFKELINWLEFNANFYLTIFTHKELIPPSLIPLLDKASRINVKEAISAKEIYKVLQNYDLSIIIQSDEKKDYLTTKFVDLVYFEIPTVVHCSKGVLTEALSPLPHVKVVDSFHNLNITKWLQEFSFDRTSIDVFLSKYAGTIKV